MQIMTTTRNLVCKPHRPQKGTKPEMHKVTLTSSVHVVSYTLPKLTIPPWYLQKAAKLHLKNVFILRHTCTSFQEPSFLLPAFIYSHHVHSLKSTASFSFSWIFVSIESLPLTPSKAVCVLSVNFSFPTQLELHFLYKVMGYRGLNCVPSRQRLCLHLNSKINSTHLNRIEWGGKERPRPSREVKVIRGGPMRTLLCSLQFWPPLCSLDRLRLSYKACDEKALRIFFSNSCMEGMLNRGNLYTDCCIRNAIVRSGKLLGSTGTQYNTVPTWLEKSFHAALQSKSRVHNLS